MDQYLTPEEVAEALKVCSRTVIKMIECGKLKALCISGKKRKTYRILAKDLDRFAAEEYASQEESKEK